MAYRFGNPYTLALLVAAAVMWGLAVATFRHRTERAGRAFFGFLVGVGLWGFADAMRYAAPSGAAVLLWNRVGYLGIVLIPPTLLLFALSYAGRDRWVRRRYVAALFGVSAVAYAVVLTNHLHGLWFEVASLSPGTAPPVLVEDWGMAWYAWATYAYAVILTATYLLAREFLVANRSGTHRGQTGMVLAGLLVTSGVNLLFIFDLVSFDPAPFVFTLSGVCFGVAMFRYRLLTMLPIARDTVVREMDSGVIVLDAKGRVVDANEYARSMFGLDGSDALGRPVESVLEEYPAVLDRLGGDRSGDPLAVEVDGELRHYDLEASELSDALDAHVGRVVVFGDVTRQVDQQRRLRDRTDELERTNERLDEFARIVSHDLRSPLEVISARANLARTEEDANHHLEEIETAATRMEEMIDDLLTLARQGRTVGEREPVSLDDVAREAWVHVGSDSASLSCETAARVRADPDRLREALGNLFRNSVEHGTGGSDGPPPEGDGVHVRVGDLEDGFFVEDDGPGIPPGDRDRVFETGFTTAEDGTGFGLNIVEEVVRAHDWRIEVTEGTDGGARFEVRGVQVE